MIHTPQEIEVLRASVKRGVELLNSENVNWRERIDPWILDISNWHNCILGQFGGGDYTSYSEMIDLFWDESYETSFDFSVAHGFDGEPNDMEILTRLWLDELNDTTSSESTMF